MAATATITAGDKKACLLAVSGGAGKGLATPILGVFLDLAKLEKLCGAQIL
ncbi:hypothetical protein [Streptomyces sudanensis]|uniref:hypothetical protein n=1 Tax=Streptomyces sudanensis TaxID=436397 RepID=UPI0020CE948D|nr:hypothetical protein [Streptomyces sudanensis]MCP9957082.1 hypothetical protein [Streptomyces sudanensis]MCQ0002337.1 hypothetical protein [Streptomyces sudanensis]